MDDYSVFILEGNIWAQFDKILRAVRSVCDAESDIMMHGGSWRRDYRGQDNVIAHLQRDAPIFL